MFIDGQLCAETFKVIFLPFYFWLAPFIHMHICIYEPSFKTLPTFHQMQLLCGAKLVFGVSYVDNGKYPFLYN